jgi:hypothetical protein
MALKNPEHPGRCRASGWYHGNLPSGETLPPIEAAEERKREEEKQRQELEKRLKEHEEKMTADIEQRVVAAVNEITPAQGLPLVQVPSAHKSSCASAAVPEEQRATEGVQMDSQRYLVDDIYRRTRCELHKPFGKIKMKVCLIHDFITLIFVDRHSQW